MKRAPFKELSKKYLNIVIRCLLLNLIGIILCKTSFAEIDPVVVTSLSDLKEKVENGYSPIYIEPSEIWGLELKKDYDFSGPNNVKTVLDGEGWYGGFYIPSKKNLTLENIDLKKFYRDDGAVIYNEGGSIT
ncbi:MAG: hypothetical protein MJ247_01410 [Alphaproteobacteria bacterium]|nr:hypothetical protein [Alphaproteobacteria bacterium]